MTVFNGVNQYAIVTGATSGSAYRVHLTLGSDYPEFTGTTRYIYDGRVDGGNSYLFSSAGSNGYDRLNTDGIQVDGVGQTQLTPATCPSGSVLSFRAFSGAANSGSFNLFSRFNATEHLGIAVTQVEITTTDNATVLHRFDLSAPEGVVVADSVGDAELTLVGFAPVSRYVVSGIATGNMDGTSEADAWPNLEAAIEGLKLEYASGLPTAAVKVDLFCSNPNSVNDTSLPVYDIVTDSSHFITFIHSGANDYVVRENSENDARLFYGPSSGVGTVKFGGKGKFRFERNFNTNSSTERSIFESRSLNTELDGVIFKALNANAGTGAVIGLEQRYSGTSVRTTNCLFKGFGNSTTGRGIKQAGSSTSGEFYNNVYDTCDVALDAVTGVSRNEIYQNNNVDHQGGISDIDYMLTDGTATGSNSVSNSTLTFADAANDDYRLSSGDTDAINAGIGPALDASVPASDVDGNERTGNDSEIGLAEFVATRQITNIDGDNDVQAGQENVTIPGIGYDLPISSVTLSGKALSVTGSPTATSIDVTIPLHIDLEWGSDSNVLAVTDNTGTVTLNNVTLSAPNDWVEVIYDGSAPDTTPDGSFYEMVITDLGYTMQASDRLVYIVDTITTTPPGDEASVNVSVNSATQPHVEPPADIAGRYKVWRAADQSFTSVSNFTITDLGLPVVADLVPGAFGFTDQIDAEPGSSYTSDLIIIYDVDDGVDIPCSITGGEYSISSDGGNTWMPFTTAPGVVRNGYMVLAKGVAGAFGQTVDVVFEAGGVSDAFSITSRLQLVPTIQTQPTAQSVDQLQTVTFTAVFNDAVSFQWFDASDDSVIAGEVATSLQFAAVLADDGRSFYCVATSSDGVTVQTNTVLLTVNEVDFNEPVITGPDDLVVMIPSDWVSVSSAHAEVQSWIASFSATDVEQGDISIAHDIPQELRISNSPYQVTISATDGIHFVSEVRTITVIPNTGLGASMLPDKKAFKMNGGTWRKLNS